MTIKVMVVDDSTFMRKILTDILQEDKELEVICTAKNGQDALDKLKEFTPDVITLDVEMPVMDGITALRLINDKYNIPVIMLSSITSEGAESTLKALEIGAIDFITKPTNIFDMGNREKKVKLLNKIKVASKIKNNKLNYSTNQNKICLDKKVISLKDSELKNIVAIGTSTGGPRALNQIVPKLPLNINSSIVVVQHMPEKFTKSLASRLNSISKIIVKEAEDGEKVRNGYCYIAPGNYHLVVKESKNGIILSLDNGPLVSGHRPSVDVMMESISKIDSLKKVAVILTGMGSDGAIGMKKIMENNGYTIAQDEKSSVVFGMPKAAIANGSVKKILPLEKISDEIINILEV